MWLWQGVDDEALREIVLHPGGESGSTLGVEEDALFEAGLSAGEIRAGEDGADVCSDTRAHVEARNVSLGVLLEMELAALPGYGGEDGLTCGSHAWMSVADDERGTMETACDEGREEVSPMHFGFTQGDTDTEDGAFTVSADAHGDEHGAVREKATVANLFITGIKDQVREVTEGSIPPELEFDVEFGGAGAHLSGTHLMATEFFDDLGDFAGGDALDIHFGHGEHEGLFAAHAFLEGVGIEVDAVAHLGDAQFDLADTGGEEFGFEAVGTTETFLAPLVGLGFENGGAFQTHGFIK